MGMFLLKKKKRKKKSQKGCIVKQHAVFSPTGQLSTFFLNCILSCRVHEMKNIVHLYNDPYYIYMGMRAKRASGLVEGCSYQKKKESERVYCQTACCILTYWAT